MAETTTRQLPAPFIEALGKTYADQLTKQVGKPVDTSKFAPQVAAQDQLQKDAASLAASGVGSYQTIFNISTTSINNSRRFNRFSGVQTIHVAVSTRRYRCNITRL